MGWAPYGQAGLGPFSSDVPVRPGPMSSSRPPAVASIGTQRAYRRELAGRVGPPGTRREAMRATMMINPSNATTRPLRGLPRPVAWRFLPLVPGGPLHQRDRRAATYARSRALIWVWYPGPCARNHASTSSSMRRVICCLRGGDLSPARTTAWANCSGDSSGMSERSMSSSLRAARRSKSVRDAFEVEGLLTVGSLPGRGDANLASSLRASQPGSPVQRPPSKVGLGCQALPCPKTFPGHQSPASL